jgi:NTP pyrophosphatase (non-canonical NTP hydrolase)
VRYGEVSLPALDETLQQSTAPADDQPARVLDWRWLQSTLALQTRVFGYTLPVQDPAELSQYLSWNLLAAYQELGEIGVEFSWKPWAVDEPFAARERIKDEIVDVMHFLGNMLVALGVDDEELEDAYQRKQAKNERRHDSGTYSAKKGSLGEGSEA